MRVQKDLRSLRKFYARSKRFMHVQQQLMHVQRNLEKRYRFEVSILYF